MIDATQASKTDRHVRNDLVSRRMSRCRSTELHEDLKVVDFKCLQFVTGKRSFTRTNVATRSYGYAYS